MPHDRGRGLLNRSVENSRSPRIDYLVTVDIAKDLSMMQRSERDFETRRYFIQKGAAGIKDRFRDPHPCRSRGVQTCPQRNDRSASNRPLPAFAGIAPH